MTITVVDTDTVTEVEMGDQIVRITTVGQTFDPADHGALGGLADDDHPQYMQHLIYDPAGKTANVFDLTNHTGSLDAGLFT